MSGRVRRTQRHPALKHAGYSTTALLPGESRSQFKKLHRDLIKELRAEGALEHDIVSTMARLVFRKQHLATFRWAELAQERAEKIQDNYLTSHYNKVFSEENNIDDVAERDPDEYADPVSDDETEKNGSVSVQTDDPVGDQSRQELGTAYALVEMGDAVTVDRLIRDLEVERRIDSQIDACLKRLLLLRGVKSLTPSAQSLPPPMEAS